METTTYCRPCDTHHDGFGLAADESCPGFYGPDIDGDYEDYEPNPYDGTYSEE